MSKVRWTCTSHWEKSKRARWLIYIMLTLTNSYWCFFINESDTAQTAWRGSRSSTEMKLYWNLVRINQINLSQASMLVSPDTKGEILDFLMQVGNIFEAELVCLCPRVWKKTRKTWIRRTEIEQLDVCENEKWQDRIHLCSIVQSQSAAPLQLHWPSCCLAFVSHSPIVSPFLCPGCSKEYGSNLHARPGGCGHCVCALQLSSGFQVKAITLPN